MSRLCQFYFISIEGALLLGCKAGLICLSRFVIKDASLKRSFWRDYIWMVFKKNTFHK